MARTASLQEKRIKEEKDEIATYSEKSQSVYLVYGTC